MVSIKVETIGNDNKAAVEIEMRGNCGDIIHEIALGAVAAIRTATGNVLPYSDAIRLTSTVIAELDDEDLEEKED